MEGLCTSVRETLTRAQNLRQGIVMNTSFGTRVSRMGLPFCGKQHFYCKI